MSKNSILGIVFFLSIFFAKGQNTMLDSAMVWIKEQKYHEAELRLNKVNDASKKVFDKWLTYYQKGKELDTLDLVLTKDPKHNNLVQLYLGDYYFIKEKEDSLAHKLYVKALKKAKEHKDTVFINETLIKLCDLQFIVRNDKLLKKYVGELETYKKDNTDFFYATYFTIVTQLNQRFKTGEAIQPNFKELEKYTSFNKYLEAELYNLKGLYYNVFVRDNEKALQENQKAIDIYARDTNYYMVKKMNNIKINSAILYFNQQKYKRAINLLKEPLQSTAKNDAVLKRIINHWLYRCYDSLNQIDKAYYHLKETNNLIKELALDKHAKSIISLEGELALQEKEKELKQIIDKNEKLKTNMNTILPILAIITLLLAIVFFLYKKYYKKTETLEEEKSETLVKLDELKQIVIKNHIVLKDKTKVYIADLLYIKSDDHYLKIFLSNGKNHFVRGKLNAIVEQLPPNFIRCHRSYIVNRNFIKQINNTNIVLTNKTEIPLSRSYKDKF